MFKLLPDQSLFDASNRITTWMNAKNITQQKALWHCCKLVEKYGYEVAEREIKKRFSEYPKNWIERILNKTCIEFPLLEGEEKEPEYVPEIIINFKPRKSKMICVTSISPTHILKDQQRRAIDSWLRLGMKVYSLNCAEEIKVLEKNYPDVNFIETTDTGKAIFGKPFVRINALINFGMKQKCDSFMLINSDIILDYNVALCEKIEKKSKTDFVYLIRWDYSVTFSDGRKQPWGIDAFIFNKKNAKVISQQKYCLGTPWFDQWLPTSISNAKLPMFTINEPFLYHRLHKQQWSRECWVTNGLWIADELKVNAKTWDELQALCIKLRTETNNNTKIL